MAAFALAHGLRLTHLQWVDRIRFVSKCKEKLNIIISQSQTTARCVICRNASLFWGGGKVKFYIKDCLKKILQENPRLLVQIIFYHLPNGIDRRWSSWAMCKICTAALLSLHIRAQCWVWMSTAGFSWHWVPVAVSADQQGPWPGMAVPAWNTNAPPTWHRQWEKVQVCA